jgi:hypothetical protein
MAVTVYKSTDANAPVLTGAAGSLITLLDAILVNGYGAKAAAGWTKPYSWSNGAVYRNSAALGSGLFLNIDDNGAGPNSAREARARGFEFKTLYDPGAAQLNGTGPFPTTTQLPAGIAIAKSMSLDQIARKWIAIADTRTLYLFTLPGHWQGYSAFMFGDFFSLGGNADVYRCAIIGRSAETLQDSIDSLHTLTALTISALGHYTPRAYATGLSQQVAIQLGKHGNAAHSTTFLVGLAVLPNVPDASIQLSPVAVHEPVPAGAAAAAVSGRAILRGRLRGFWHFLHPLASNINDGDTFQGQAGSALAGKAFIIIKPAADAQGIYIIETSDTWETN